MSRHRFQNDAVSYFPSLPNGWREERIHDVAELRTSNVDKKSAEGETPVRLCNYVDVYKNDKVTMSLDFMEATATEAQIERFALQVGDVVITKDSETPDDIGVPALIAETAPDLVCGYHLTILRPDASEVAGGYLFYAVASRLSAYQFYLAANGVTRFGLTYQGTKNLRIAFPPLPEQQQIAAFLDWKTGQIDGLIAKKRALLEKLKEKRLAVITLAVTRGLNPAAPLKDSGTPWLDKVPASWEVMRLKDYGRLVGGAGFPIDEQGLMEEELPFYKVADLKEAADGRNMAEAPNTISRGTAQNLAAKIIPAGAVVYAKIGAALLLNRRRITTVECCIDNNMSAYIPDPAHLEIRWVYYWLSILDFGEFVNPGAVPSLSEGYQSVIPILVPDIDEQAAIADYLDSVLPKIDQLVNAMDRTIARLTEYRTALITAATTGKIDVREVKIPQPAV